MQLVKEDEIEGAGAISLHSLQSFPLTTGTFSFPQPNSPSPTHAHLVLMGPGGCLNFMWFTSTFLSVLSIYEYLSWSFAALHVKVSGWFSTDWWVCWVHVSVHTAVVDAARPDSLPSPSSAAVSSGQRGEISSPSTAMATACKSPWASCTPQRPFTVRGWLLMSPGECQGKIEVDAHAQTLVQQQQQCLHGYYGQQHDSWSIWTHTKPCSYFPHIYSCVYNVSLTGQT